MAAGAPALETGAVLAPGAKVIVLADALTAPDGVLRIWETPWHESRVVPALSALLELPFERIIVSHVEPVHSRAEYERALGSKNPTLSIAATIAGRIWHRRR